MNLDEILEKTRDGNIPSKEELVALLNFAPDSEASFRIMAEANRISKELSDGKAEIHAQLAVNLAPCNCECLFCSFARKNNVFTSSTEITPDQGIAYACQLEQDGANAVYMMSTAQYPLERFLEMGKEIKKHLNPKTLMIANVGDQSLKNAIKLKDTGFTGVYHAVRLREGKDTALSPDIRIQSIRNLKEVGLAVGTCVEPVGPEHTNEELADMIELTASFEPAYSGAARRILIPGTEIAKRGMISELRMAQIVAVTRMGMPRSVMGNCTHEPCTLGAIAGANLFWAEVGANPRDIEEQTEKGRGVNVTGCRSIYRESNWDVWDQSSRYF